MDSFDEALTLTTRVNVYDCGLLDYGDSDERGAQLVIDGPPVLEVRRPLEVSQLVDLLRTRGVTDVRCMCAGDTTFELFDEADELLATVGLHHARRLRWRGWEGDADLVDGAALASWLHSHGHVAPQNALERSEAQRSMAEQQRQNWTEAAPAALSDITSELIATSQTGVVPAALLAEVERRLRVAYVEAVDRARALLVWHSAGSGRCSGLPVHETIPGRLLSEESISDVLEALEDSFAPEVWEGAARHLADWKSRSLMELDAVPERVWERLLEVAETTGDSDKIGRLTRAHTGLHR